MEHWSLLEDTRWKIIDKIADGGTMAEIADSVGTTVANVSQHLKLLEAYGYVKKEKRNNGKPGKPTFYYTLKKGFSLLAVATDKGATRKEINLKDRYHRMIISIFLLGDSEDHYYLHKLLWQNEELIKKCKSISYLKSDDKQIELFVITDKLEEIRKNFSNVTLKNPEGKEKKIVCWSHNESEVDEGLESNDDYYKNLVKNPHVIHDPEDIMKKWI